MKKQLLLLLAVPFLLTGCVNKADPPAVEDEYDLTYKYEDLASDPDYEPVSEMSISTKGWLTEIENDRCLSTDTIYEIYVTNPGFTAKSSNTNHAEIVTFEGEDYFEFKTKTAGDTILTIYNASGAIIFRRVVRVRPAQTKEEILTVCCAADHFKSVNMGAYNGNYRYTLLDNNTGKSILKGSDEMEASFSATFDLEYKRYSADFDFYVFECKNETGYSANTYVSSVCFSRVGDVAYIFYKSNQAASDEGLLTITYSSDVEYIYKNYSK